MIYLHCYHDHRGDADQVLFFTFKININYRYDKDIASRFKTGSVFLCAVNTIDNYAKNIRLRYQLVPFI